MTLPTALAEPRPAPSSWLLLAVLSLIWGTSFQFNKLAVAAIEPDVVVAFRLLSAAVLLTPLVYLRGERLPTVDRRWPLFVLMAALGNALPFYLISWGQQRVDSGVAGVLMATMPLATLLLAHVFIVGEAMTGRRAAGFLLGFAGVCLLIGPSALLRVGGDLDHAVRQCAIAFAAVCYAGNTILARRLPPTSALVTSTCVMIAGAAIMLPLVGGRALADLAHAPTSAALSVVWLGAVSTALAMLLYYRIINTVGATFVSQMNYLIPVVAFTGGITWMGERPSWWSAAALVVILAGLALGSSGRPART
jgi:drug/metabolite transporter (DMT)-like permease